MIFLLANWRWLVPSAAAAFLGIWLGVAKVEIAGLRQAAAEKAIVSRDALIDANNKTAVADAKAARIALDLEEERATHIKDIADTRGAFAADLDKRLRKTGTDSCGGKLPVAAAAAPVVAEPAGGSDGRYSAVDPEAVSVVRDTALKLQADVKTCWEWASQVGK